MFEREHHRRIQAVLSRLNAPFLLENQCYFGGGTAIVLLLGEYRESLDIDFLCASQAGYSALRNTIDNASLGAILAQQVKILREIRADRYGIRTFLEVDGQAIKFEIVREDRIELHGETDAGLGVPLLARVDMFAEKLLANADRYNDNATANRDIIDLAMMIEHWGAVPAAAWEKTRRAYGASVDKAFNNAIIRLSNQDHLASCLAKMHMDKALAERIPALLERNVPAA
jgi:hypothetical protein